MEEFANIMENVWKSIECPTCKQLLTPPIYICTRNHQLCKDCRQRSTSCAQCGQVFPSALADTQRNLLAEEIVRKLPLPCPNRHLGCPRIFKDSSVEYHRNVCDFRAYKCPWFLCRYEIGRSVMVKHFADFHPTSLLVKGAPNARDVVSWTGSISKGLLIIFQVPDWGEFFFRSKMTAGGWFHLWLQYLGTEREARAFHYQLIVTDIERNQEMMYSSQPESLRVSREDIIQASNCLIISQAMMKRHESNMDNLKYRVNITLESVQHEMTAQRTSKVLPVKAPTAI